MRRPQGLQLVRAMVLLCVMMPLGGCKFGMEYSGETAGLLRESITVEDDESRHLSYLIGGEPGASRVIFIHGSPGRATGYVSYLHEPIRRHEIIAVDRLGYGESGGGVETSFERQAKSIAPLLERRNGRWPIVVGHSLGGPIACRLAADNPGKIAGLVIAGGSLDPDLEEMRWYNRAMATPIVNLTAHEKLRVSNQEIMAAKGELELLAPMLGSIECPIIIVHGTRDSLVHYDNVGYMLENFTGAQEVKVVTLYGEDHFITREREEEIREAVLEMHGMAP